MTKYEKMDLIMSDQQNTNNNYAIINIIILTGNLILLFLFLYGILILGGFQDVQLDVIFAYIIVIIFAFLFFNRSIKSSKLNHLQKAGYYVNLTLFYLYLTIIGFLIAIYILFPGDFRVFG